MPHHQHCLCSVRGASPSLVLLWSIAECFLNDKLRQTNETRRPFGILCIFIGISFPYRADCPTPSHEQMPFCLSPFLPEIMTLVPWSSNLRIGMHQVSFCLMKKDRRCESCHAHVPPKTTSWISIHRTTRPLVASDWSLNSASRSCHHVSH